MLAVTGHQGSGTTQPLSVIRATLSNANAQAFDPSCAASVNF